MSNSSKQGCAESRLDLRRQQSIFLLICAKCKQGKEETVELQLFATLVDREDTRAESPMDSRATDSIQSPLDRNDNGVVGFAEDMPPFTANLTFQNVSCSVQYSNTGNYLKDLFCCAQTTEKKILRKVSGIVKAGQLMGIIGPSGGGKTTLLDILAGRKKSGKVTGEVFVNGAPISNSPYWKRISGYVTQDDVLDPAFTVRETLRYAALLRLPSSMSKALKYERVEQVIADLALQHVADSAIGGQWVRGISGGEKRRVSIGIELITNPSLIFLDEPTSGLDSHSAELVMRLLQQMASQQKRTIICTIHQPSSKLYTLFDQLMVLAPKGRLVYIGPAQSAHDYFLEIGHECPSGWNPADFFLDMVSYKKSDGDVETPVARKSVSSLVSLFQKSTLGQQFKLDLAAFHKRTESAVNNAHALSAFKGAYANGFFTQLFILSHRNLIRYFRRPIEPLQYVGGYLISAILIALIFSDIRSNKEAQITLGLSFMLDVFSVFSLFAIPTIMSNRLLFIRERDTGAYRTSSYFVADVICRLPQHLFAVFIYSTIILYLSDIHGTYNENGAYLLLINTVVMQVYLAINETVGACLSDGDTAIVLAGLINVLNMIFSGCFAQYPNLPKFLIWGYWSSPMSYGTNALLINQFEGTPQGDAYLHLYGVQLMDKWENLYILLGFLGGIRIFTYFALRFLQKEKR